MNKGGCSHAVRYMVDVDALIKERKEEVIDKAEKALERNDKVVEKAREYVKAQKEKKVFH